MPNNNPKGINQYTKSGGRGPSIKKLSKISSPKKAVTASRYGNGSKFTAAAEKGKSKFTSMSGNDSKARKEAAIKLKGLKTLKKQLIAKGDKFGQEIVSKEMRNIKVTHKRIK